MALYDLGRSTEADAAFATYLEFATDNTAWGIAKAYAWTGRNDEAFDAIYQAASQEQLREDGEVVRWNPIYISLACTIHEHRL